MRIQSLFIWRGLPIDGIGGIDRIGMRIEGRTSEDWDQRSEVGGQEGPPVPIAVMG